ncbi:hypothetical protein EK21DRAFT_92238 [Setomelanomma holmii]|uniref:Uncharacterized protein n=1 Tax=Setomelanomma holmii TaxID=210430 RepID=A0A9P4H3H9_9PLEO|nr:hypothetical protein EK21DRAFT_92238 [Setomelanomma holmii]
MAQCVQVYATLQQRDNDLNRRYVADMRLITAITLISLPGTFVATLFSTSFWTFDPRSSGSPVSKWVWMYFIITVFLTTIVLAVWRGYTALRSSLLYFKAICRVRYMRIRHKRGKKQDDAEATKKGS